MRKAAARFPAAGGHAPRGRWRRNRRVNAGNSHKYLLREREREGEKERERDKKRERQRGSLSMDI